MTDTLTPTTPVDPAAQPTAALYQPVPDAPPPASLPGTPVTGTPMAGTTFGSAGAAFAPQAPPDAEPDDRRGRWLMVLLLVGILAVLAGLVAVLTRPGDDAGSRARASTPSLSSPVGVESPAVDEPAIPDAAAVEVPADPGVPVTVPVVVTTVPAAPAPTVPPTTAPAPTTPPTTAPTTTTPPTTVAPSPTFDSATTAPTTISCPAGGGTVDLTLTWTTTGATSVDVSIDGPGKFASYAADGSATVPFACPGPHTYTLTAHGPGGTTTVKTFTVSAPPLAG